MDNFKNVKCYDTFSKLSSVISGHFRSISPVKHRYVQHIFINTCIVILMSKRHWRPYMPHVPSILFSSIMDPFIENIIQFIRFSKKKSLCLSRAQMFLKDAIKFCSILRYFDAIKSFDISVNVLLFLDLTNVFFYY